VSDSDLFNPNGRRIKEGGWSHDRQVSQDGDLKKGVIVQGGGTGPAQADTELSSLSKAKAT